MKTLKIEAKKAYRGSVTFNVTKDGSLEQVINLYKAAEEPTSVVLHTTPHGKLSATKHGLNVNFSFQREKLNYDQIIDHLYDEVDEMMEYVQTQQTDVEDKILKTFGQSITKLTVEKGQAA